MSIATSSQTLPEKRKILVTCALPYANGSIHLGHLLEHIQTDIWVRFQRMRGHETYFVCADDAHGTPIMLKAQELGVTPEDMINTVRDEHMADFADFHISFDNYHSTHCEENEALASDIYNKLHAKGHIKTRTISQLYDPEKGMFLPDRFIKGTCPKCKSEDENGDSCDNCGATYSPTEVINPRSVVSGAAPILKDSEHYFFDLPAFEEMLKDWIRSGALQEEMANKLGGDRVEFHKGYIQDLALDVQAMELWLTENPVKDIDGLQALEEWKTQQKTNTPLIKPETVDLVISNCVLNLVAQKDRQQLIAEIFRVLKPGGRVAISDIVCDERVPEHLQNDPTLWSGCISGAFHEKGFLDAFVNAGFVAVNYDKWDSDPWQVVEGIEFRSVTLMAIKPDQSQALDAGQAVMYKGPFLRVRDDQGNVYLRGERMAVSAQTYSLLMNSVYADSFIGIEPAEGFSGGDYAQAVGALRSVAETKGGKQQGAGGNCC